MFNLGIMSEVAIFIDEIRTICTQYLLYSFLVETFLDPNMVHSPISIVVPLVGSMTVLALIFFKSNYFISKVYIPPFAYPFEYFIFFCTHRLWRLVLYIDPCPSVRYSVCFFFKTALRIFPIFCTSVEEIRCHHLSHMVFLDNS